MNFESVAVSHIKLEQEMSAICIDDTEDQKRGLDKFRITMFARCVLFLERRMRE
jgi:hypothetical protein